MSIHGYQKSKKAPSVARKRDKRPRATARYVRISSRKVKIVIDLIRGKTGRRGALPSCLYTPKAASPVVREAAQFSAIANAREQPEHGP
ncbi:MAG: large ribosomal subunit protein uL22 [Christensenellales bacterium]